MDGGREGGRENHAEQIPQYLPQSTPVVPVNVPPMNQHKETGKTSSMERTMSTAAHKRLQKPKSSINELYTALKAHGKYMYIHVKA